MGDNKMVGYRFYLEYPDKRSKQKATVKSPGAHVGNVVAAILREDGNFQHNYHSTDAISAVLFTANSPVVYSAVGFEYLQEVCKRIPESLAREIHPVLFNYLEQD